jgi:hypothetical protein
MRIKTSMNSKEFKTKGEWNYNPTLTVPDHTLSIRQILERHSRGLPLEGWRTPIWDGEDNELPDIRTLDLAERQELAELYQQELNNYNKKSTNVDKVENNERVDEIESISGEPTTDL